MAIAARASEAVEPRAARTEQLSMRIGLEEKAVLKQAARLQRQTVTEFVLSAARREADRIVSAHQSFELSERDSRALMDSLLNPRPFAPRLQQALKRHSQRYGDA